VPWASDFRVIFGSSVTSTVIVVFVLNLVFNHWTRRPQSEHAVTVAVRAGASAVSVADDGPAGQASFDRHSPSPPGCQDAIDTGLDTEYRIQ
jgi:NCS2 family nucleobase:cation symporter-2